MKTYKKLLLGTACQKAVPRVVSGKHPVFVAQHACACCCRGCLFKWYKVPQGRELTEEEQRRIVNLLILRGSSCPFIFYIAIESIFASSASVKLRFSIIFLFSVICSGFEAPINTLVISSR